MIAAPCRTTPSARLGAYSSTTGTAFPAIGGERRRDSGQRPVRTKSGRAVPEGTTPSAVSANRRMSAKTGAAT